MCGRFASALKPSDAWLELMQEWSDGLFDRYNVSSASQIGADDDNGVTLPIPHAYFKSVLTENDKGALRMWSFIIPNESSDKQLDEFLVSTGMVEKMSGLFLWESLVGTKITREKNRIRKMW